MTVKEYKKIENNIQCLDYYIETLGKNLRKLSDKAYHDHIEDIRKRKDDFSHY